MAQEGYSGHSRLDHCPPDAFLEATLSVVLSTHSEAGLWVHCPVALGKFLNFLIDSSLKCRD